MSNLAYEEKYTTEDYRHWEGDWELIHGDTYAMAPSPMYGHQHVSGKIFRQLDEQLDTCRNCHATFEMDVEFSDDTVVRPDCMVFCYEPQDRLTQPPEIIFEVISRSTAKRDEILKFDLYQNQGVRYYTIVYPENQKAKLYKLSNGRYIKAGDFSDEQYRFETSRGCGIDFDFGFIWRR